jgi:hypothetical protein
MEGKLSIEDGELTTEFTKDSEFFDDRKEAHHRTKVT